MDMLPMIAPTPASELLLRCARTRVSELHIARIHHLVEQDLDWMALYDRTMAHQVYPTVYASLSAVCRDAVPTEVMEAFQEMAIPHLKYNTLLASELIRLVDVLTSHHVRVLPFKGPVLARVAYGGLARRTYNDLDLLIHPRDFRKAERLLLAHGYAPRRELGALRKELFLQLESGYVFRNEAIGFEVDLHTRVAPHRYSYPVSFDELWERSEEVNLNITSVRSLGTLDLLHLLCWHGAKHQWILLKFICDVAELVEATPELDWDAMHRRARHLRAENILYVGLRLAHDMLGLELPGEVLREMKQEAYPTALVPHLTADLLADEIERPGYFRHHRFQLQMRSTLASKLRYACSTLAFNKLSRRVLLGS